MTDPSVPAVIEMVDVALRSNFLTPASEPKLTTHDEVHKAVRGLKFSKAPDPNVIRNRALMHLPQRALSLMAQIFNAVLLTHHIPRVWKHAKPSQAKVLTGGGDLREAQVDVPLSVSHSCV